MYQTCIQEKDDEDISVFVLYFPALVRRFVRYPHLQPTLWNDGAERKGQFS